MRNPEMDPVVGPLGRGLVIFRPMFDRGDIVQSRDRISHSNVFNVSGVAQVVARSLPHTSRILVREAAEKRRVLHLAHHIIGPLARLVGRLVHDQSVEACGVPDLGGIVRVLALAE